MDAGSPALVSLRNKFWIATLLSVAFIFIMKFSTAPLTSREVVDFELAKTTDKAAAILESWNSSGLLPLFQRSILLDFFFIVFYSAALFWGCRFSAGLSGNYILRKAGHAFSWLVLVAAICDVLENLGMIYTINNSVPPGWAVEFSYDMALIKFSIIMIALLFILICFIIWGIGRIAR